MLQRPLIMFTIELDRLCGDMDFLLNAIYIHLDN